MIDGVPYDGNLFLAATQQLGIHENKSQNRIKLGTLMARIQGDCGSVGKFVVPDF